MKSTDGPNNLSSSEYICYMESLQEKILANGDLQDFFLNFHGFAKISGEHNGAKSTSLQLVRDAINSIEMIKKAGIICFNTLEEANSSLYPI